MLIYFKVQIMMNKCLSSVELRKKDLVVINLFNIANWFNLIKKRNYSWQAIRWWQSPIRIQSRAWWDSIRNEVKEKISLHYISLWTFSTYNLLSAKSKRLKHVNWTSDKLRNILYLFILKRRDTVDQGKSI